MYLNMASKSVDNKIIGKVNDCPLILMGHVEERYNERVKPLYDSLKVHEISFDKLIKSSIRTINRKLDILDISNGKSRYIHKVKIPVYTETYKIMVEVAVLLTSSTATMSSMIPNAKLPQYVDISIGDQVYCIETVSAAIMIQGERNYVFTKNNIRGFVQNISISRHMKNETLCEIITDDKIYVSLRLRNKFGIYQESYN